MLLEEYNGLINNLYKTYGDLVEQQFLPTENWTLEAVEEEKKNLTNQTFLVSFTGQIKAGKSTLINSIIFGENILPTDDMPHTAKITIIEYGDTPRFKVKFYSESEWEKLKNLKLEGGKSTYYDKHLKQEVNDSISEGIYPENYIKEEPYEIIEKDLSKMVDYVAAEGIYTPFVNQIKIYYPSEMLKKITFVDTPGINDPNIVRSKTTIDWIKNANANIYITYANRSLDKTDISFIDEFLFHVPKSRRIIAVNKIDTIASKDDLNSWVSELKNNPELAKRDIIDNDTNIHYISSLGYMINSLLKNDKTLDEDMEFYRSKLEKSGFLDDNKNNVKKLIDSIEKQIISDKGQGIILSHKQKIISILRDNEKDLKKDIELNNEQQKLYLTDKEELISKKDKIEKAEQNLSSDWNKFETNIRKQMDKFYNEFRDSLNKMKRKICGDITNELEMIDNIKLLKFELKWIIKKELENNEKKLYDMVDSKIAETKEMVDENIENYKERYEGIFDSDIVSLMMSVPLADTVENLQEMCKATFNKDKIQDIISDSTWFFQRWFNTEGGKAKAVSALEDAINNYLEEAFVDSFARRLNDQMRSELNKFIENIQNSVIDYKDKIKEDISKVLESLDERENNLSKLKDEKQQLINKLKDVENETNNIKALLDF